MIDAKLLAFTGVTAVCLFVVGSGYAGWSSDQVDAGATDISIESYCNSVKGTNQEDSCGICAQWIATGATLETVLFCHDDDAEGSITIGNLLALAGESESDADVWDSFCSMDRDERVELVASKKSDRMLARIATRMATAQKPEEGRKLVWNPTKNYGWCSMDIGFLTKAGDAPWWPARSNADTADYCPNKYSNSQGDQNGHLSKCCINHDKCLMCEANNKCDANTIKGAPGFGNDMGGCDSALSRCANQVRNSASCSGCSGCSWRGCSGCSGCSAGNSFDEWPAAKCVSLGMAARPNGGYCRADCTQHKTMQEALMFRVKGKTCPFTGDYPTAGTSYGNVR